MREAETNHRIDKGHLINTLDTGYRNKTGMTSLRETLHKREEEDN